MHDEYHEIDPPSKPKTTHGTGKTSLERSVARATSNSKIWRKIIGKKIICSKCESKNPNAFNFKDRMGNASTNVLSIECMNCKHKGDYRLTQVEVSLFESAAKKIIEEQVEEKYGEKAARAISNIEVESVYRDDKDETNYAIEA